MSEARAIDLPLEAGGDLLRAAIAAAVRPRELLTVSQWADQHRVLARSASNEPGRWRTSRTPYLREIMDGMGVDQVASKTILMCGTQLGKSEALLNVCGYVIDYAPGPILLVQPTSDTGKRFSRQRVQPMIDQSDTLSALVEPVKSRDSGNTLRLKEFPGGMLAIAGANSTADLRSMPVRWSLEDECDEYPDDLAGQGSVDDLVDRRTSSYGARRKRLRCSSPTIADCSDIEASFRDSDQRELFAECPGCGDWAVMRDELLTDAGERLCEACGQLFGEAACKAHWYQDPPRIEWRAQNPGHAVRGYHLASFYSALGLGYTWVEIAQMRDKSKHDPLKLKSYTNTILGLAYRDAANRVEPSDLLERRETWTLRSPPPGVLIVTAAVDVQANRFAVALWGWGRREIGWWLDYVELPGNPSNPDDWIVVDEYLARPLRNHRQRVLPIRVVAVDSGAFTHDVYGYVRPRQVHGWIAIKGLSTGGKAIIAGRPSYQDVTGTGRTIRHGIALWRIGTDTAKATLVARMQADHASEADDRRLRFPADLPDEALEQLASEQWDQQRRRWVKVIGRRNEALDTLVYSYAAACHPTVRLHTMRDADWRRLEMELEPPTEDLFASEPEPPRTAPVRAPESGGGFIRPPVGGGSFISRRN